MPKRVGMPLFFLCFEMPAKGNTDIWHSFPPSVGSRKRPGKWPEPGGQQKVVFLEKESVLRAISSFSGDINFAFLRRKRCFRQLLSGFRLRRTAGIFRSHIGAILRRQQHVRTASSEEQENLSLSLSLCLCVVVCVSVSGFNFVILSQYCTDNNTSELLPPRSRENSVSVWVCVPVSMCCCLCLCFRFWLCHFESIIGAILNRLLPHQEKKASVSVWVCVSVCLLKVTIIFAILSPIGGNQAEALIPQARSLWASVVSISVGISECKFFWVLCWSCCMQKSTRPSKAQAVMQCSVWVYVCVCHLEHWNTIRRRLRLRLRLKVSVFYFSSEPGLYSNLFVTKRKMCICNMRNWNSDWDWRFWMSSSAPISV